MKFKTVKEGQQAVVLNHRGEGRLVVGPQRIFLFRERFKLLDSVTANRGKYVEIQDKTGTVIHKPGPCQIFNNPLEYKNCMSHKAVKVDANHMLVVYKRLKDGEAERNIIQGPAVFMPEADEWVHEFEWHGTDPHNKARMVPGLDKFVQLSVIPNNFYYNINEGRTSDDTMITVKVMLFYHMEDVLKMLETTHDPVADLINALCADVISFVGPLSYSQFVERTNLVSSLDTYPQLQHRAAAVGFKVDKVVYRGYHAPVELQTMQNNAIESRTHLRLEREIEDQQQHLVNFKLNKQQERSKIEQDTALKKQSHAQKIADLQQKHKLELEEMKLKHELEMSAKETELELEVQEQQNKHGIEHLKSLGSIDVDVNKYLTLKNKPIATEEIQIVPNDESRQTSSETQLWGDWSSPLDLESFQK